MKLQNKITVVTGASTGIGRAIAKAFAQEGAFVYLLGRNKERLEETLREIDNKGKVQEIDLRDRNAINAFIEKVKEEQSKVDILANIAGIYHSENKAYTGIAFTDYSEDEILDTYKIGIDAPTLLSYGIIPLMPKGSKIINLSGTFESGAKGWLPYYVSKKALEDLTVGLSQELRDKEIQVNCISPSDTLTESYQKFFPEYANEEESVKPEEIGHLAIFLASTEADNITGQIIIIKHK